MKKINYSKKKYKILVLLTYGILAIHVEKFETTNIFLKNNSNFNENFDIPFGKIFVYIDICDIIIDYQQIIQKVN